MPRFFVLAHPFLLAIALLATPVVAAVRTLDVGVAPESVTKGWDGDYYVTLMGSRDANDPNSTTDGEVRRVTPDGQVTIFATGFDQPKGIVFSGEHLYFTDLHTVWRLDQSGAKSVLAGPDAFPVPPTYLNDIAVDPTGRGVFITEMGAIWEANGNGPRGLLPVDDATVLAKPPPGRIYHVSWEGQVTLVVGETPMMRYPNGLYVEPDGRILVCAFFLGDILAITPGLPPQIIASGHRSADGVETDEAGNLIITEVRTGQIFLRAPNGHAPRLLHTAKSAADHYLDRTSHTLIVPDTASGQLVFIDLAGL